MTSAEKHLLTSAAGSTNPQAALVSAPGSVCKKSPSDLHGHALESGSPRLAACPQAAAARTSTGGGTSVV